MRAGHRAETRNVPGHRSGERSCWDDAKLLLLVVVEYGCGDVTHHAVVVLCQLSQGVFGAFGVQRHAVTDASGFVSGESLQRLWQTGRMGSCLIADVRV